MELAQSLVRSCVRSFYDTKHILVIDALIIHSALRDDDMAYLMGMNTKELHKLCGRLREDRFLAVHTRAEVKEGQQRPMNRTYYYIDYRATIDAIKWRVYLMNKKVQGNTVPEQERKEWFCSRCKSEWTQIEVLDKWDMARGFLCHKCGFVLTHDPENNRGGHEQSTKYHAQFRFITDMLPKLDEVIIPENNFDKAFASQLKVVRDETNPANETAPVDASAAKPTAVRGMTNVGPTSINVTLTASEGPTDADIAAEQARKEKIASQNAMPVHFTHSTITGEQVKFTQPSFHSSQSLEPDKKDLDTPSINGDGAEIDDYFARLKAEQAKEAEREKEEEFETDDEEDEEDFEDVVATGSGFGTPASSAGDVKPNAAALANGLTSILKKSGSASASGTSTGATSPVTGPGTPIDDGRPAKKVKIEEPTPKEEDESEEDMEFEDV
ncbi:related to transcription initiation factor IIE chain TFA1 [Phialocephala subalpina]|uniref:Related to transcription initiation factor IIE chain TFA1 n=1 Tax=Phialocephala subalpina TaxID=576137 RepID=A0A1L7XQE0_9HELO|nr:related to transcription initiation factor IIE chain TFA1 [Phialocephala subalpina]